MHGGVRVAVKVQHRGHRQRSRTDLEILRHILGLSRSSSESVGSSHHTDIAQLIREELDFEQEARNIVTIQAHFAGSNDVHFPVVLHELSPRAC